MGHHLETTDSTPFPFNVLNWLSDLFGGSLLAPAMISFTICVTIAGLAG